MTLELKDITGIGKTTAERLNKAGITSVEKLASMKLDDLLKIKGIGRTSAEKYLNIAQKLLEEKNSSKTEESMVSPKEEEKPKPKPKKVPKPDKEARKKLKELIKTQAECNIGLVGHVDHGKTTLVETLTGDWTDRHSEEQERGISIKLGYSNATILYCPECDKYTTLHMLEEERKEGQSRLVCLNCGNLIKFKRNISFVDAPGHEILMATMLSGASLMDGACLLIAADESCPQPQTREHLAALNIAGIENIIIIQNKIDAVSKEEARKNYQEIKEFVKGTVAENAPIIPISAVFSANIDLVVKAFEEVIPTPKLDKGEDFEFLIARSFDINRPGTEIENLKGGVIGGSVLKGQVKVGDQIEIKPGLKIKEDYIPIESRVVSISQGKNFFDSAKPGGLIGLGTKLDPSLTKGDALIGDVAGHPGTLGEILNEVELEVHLLDRVIGTEDQIKVHDLKHNERLLIVVGTQKTAGIVTKILKNTYIIKLTPPICPPEDFIFAISRIINRRYRLIGYGIRIE
jgi:translation initiation factor 2 subunit 3